MLKTSADCCGLEVERGSLILVTADDVLLDEFYRSQNVCEAETKFDSLCSWMRRCRLEPMKEAAQTLINHKKRIINYFRNRLTNAICEGINSMIQTAKRKARGYRTFDGYATMIYIVAGKLDIDDPFALPV